MRLYVNSEAVIGYTRTLGNMHKSALPLAIRGALNDSVYDVKTKSMPKSASVFKKRSPNFFKANSKFENAKGFDVSSMKSIVGFYENKLEGKNNYAVKDLEQQEHGGNIGGKALIPMKAARVSGVGITKGKYRRSNIRDYVDASRVKSISGYGAKNLSTTVRKQKLIRAAIKASLVFGSNAYVLGNANAAGKKTLFKVDKFLKIGDKLDMKLTPLFSVKKGMDVQVNATKFMQKASISTHSLMGKFFISQAEKQFQRLMKK